MSNDALKSFTTNSVKDSHEKEYRKMYIVETTRFDKKKFIPHYSSCFSENFVFVAEAVDKKLNLIIKKDHGQVVHSSQRTIIQANLI